MEDQLFEVYVRDVNGNTRHCDIRDGMKEFLGDEGYRISVNIEGVVITLRKGVAYDKDIKMLDEDLTQESVECLATVRQ